MRLGVSSSEDRLAELLAKLLADVVANSSEQK